MNGESSYWFPRNWPFVLPVSETSIVPKLSRTSGRVKRIVRYEGERTGPQSQLGFLYQNLRESCTNYPDRAIMLFGIGPRDWDMLDMDKQREGA